MKVSSSVGILGLGFLCFAETTSADIGLVSRDVRLTRALFRTGATVHLVECTPPVASPTRRCADDETLAKPGTPFATYERNLRTAFGIAQHAEYRQRQQLLAATIARQEAKLRDGRLSEADRAAVSATLRTLVPQKALLDGWLAQADAAEARVRTLLAALDDGNDLIVDEGESAYVPLGASYHPPAVDILGFTTTDVAGEIVVTSVVSGSRAAEAGFRMGNVITAFNGRRIETTRQLHEAVIDAYLEKDRHRVPYASITISLTLRNGDTKWLCIFTRR